MQTKSKLCISVPIHHAGKQTQIMYKVHSQAIKWSLPAFFFWQTDRFWNDKIIPGEVACKNIK